ncbi:hypothetical protein [Labedella endophytica]|uniref:Uncharacterized protein n=1 Tax=Labedella endophytica TaxID=1523160 RepID=A0A433JSG6_9MICO|nr:hypothetical protein [Labedella endophytica]RUR01251.1 hypothetical protein ELQ94_06990 [Labedella endophytica]
MQSIDVALRRNASDVFGVPGIGSAGAFIAAHVTLPAATGLVERIRVFLVRRVPLLLALVLIVQLLGGVLADPTRAIAPVMSTAATVAGAVTSGAATASAAAASIRASVSVAAGSAALQSIAVAAHVDPAERDAAFVLLDSTRVTPAVAGNPRAVDRILDAALPATRVAAWWSTLTVAQRTDLAAASPTLVGNLDGVPLDDRIAANREAAARALAAYPRNGSDLASVEASYLARVASGAVSLYAFDVARDAIVEIIGDAVAATRALVFTPGTTASLSDFYGGSMQSLASWEVEHAAASDPTVAFVYKIGSFPQWSITDGPLDNQRSIELGVLFDRFNDGLDTTVVGALARTSVEHSFGSSIGGVAETLGTHFATRIVLGGVGMLAGWQPSTTTRYVAYVAGNDVTRYIYGLAAGDDVGYAVAPSAVHGFEQKDPQLQSDAWYLPLRLIGSIVGPAIEVAQGFINHNRVASADDNGSVLASILSDVASAGEIIGDSISSSGDVPETPAAPHLELLVLSAREMRAEQ